MKKNIANIIICPVCRNDLDKKIEKEDEESIIAGNLYCKKCNIYYPVENKIANMLPPNVRYIF
ncbi:MAG: Trm112 family protein [Methanosarcinaceae archaeon]|nr:Trm112 family protein [Methanosarcinaceae archaeon]